MAMDRQGQPFLVDVDMGLTVAYVGNTSRKLMVQSDANSPFFIPGQSTAGNINAPL